MIFITAYNFMKKINCNVTNCSHNNSNVCYSNRVNMNGTGAKKACDTCCGSFLDNNNYGDLTNNTNTSSQCDVLVCHVENCTHNRNTVCTLDSITVGSNVPVKIYSETNCTSFNAK